nr:PREDICTED: uncharacterized protein LOC105671590 [Linepithema humile]
MRILVIVIAITVTIVGAYESQRANVLFNTNVISYRKPHPRNVFLNQPFTDKTSGQRNPRDLSFGDQINYSSDFPILRHEPFKQNSFRNERLFGDAMTKNRELRGQRAILRDNPFESASFASEIFEGQASTYGDQARLKEQLFTAEAPFKNFLHAQSLSDEQASFQKQTAFETPFASNAAKFYQDDSYDKPIDSYGHKDTRTLPGESLYTEYGNHAVGLSSIPVLSSSKQLFSLNAEMFTTPSTPTHGSSSNGEARLSESWKMKFGSALGTITSTSASNCNALVDSSPTMSSGAVTTIPSISVSTNQSAIVGHILTSLTTKPNSPVTVIPTSIAPFDGNSPRPVHFHATKYGAVIASLPTEDELKNNVHGSLFANTPKSSFRTNEHNIKLLVPEEPKNNMKTNIQSPTLNYILSEKYKDGLKGIQNSFANYPSPAGLKHDWSLQQFSQPETSSNYAPLSLGTTKLILPSLPLAHVSTISWPMDVKSDVSALPAKSVISSDTATSDNLALGVNLPLGFVASVPNSPTSSISNSIFGSITDGISTGIPDSMTANMPMSIPTLSLEQTLHRAEQLRQTQEARNLWYPTGLQLQLGGFGGINYTLHSNPTAKPMELGNAEAGLTPPKLLQAHAQAPAFAKVSSQGMIANLATPTPMSLESFLNNDT